MGYQRGEMDAISKTDKSFQITGELPLVVEYRYSSMLVREDVFESLSRKHTWGILHTVDEYKRLLTFFRSNYDAGVKNRLMYTEVRSEFCHCPEVCSSLPRNSLSNPRIHIVYSLMSSACNCAFQTASYAYRGRRL